MYLEKINNVKDIKGFTLQECELLSQEIRDALLNKISKKGGHLASNLGLVELTIALHYVFNAPKDKIVFDVSHQSYTHKILTGRKNGFLIEEDFNDVCGYTNPDESEYDLFRVGHTATSISLACGIAKARDLQGGTERVIAVIGDGSLSGGEALAGLDFGAEIKGNLIIVFNDNQMSIAENHGGMYLGFKQLREREGFLEHNLFRNFGYDYRYVKNGNSIKDLVKVFSEIKGINHPIVIHISTQKGRGYRFAEDNNELSHYVKPFDIETGIETNPFNGERYDRIIRDYLLDRIKKDKKTVLMIAGVPGVLGLEKKYREQMGEQFVDVGICEEHAISMAAGLAKSGCKPVFATFSTFYQRVYDQISQDLCINKLPVTLIVADASVYAVNDVTHIGIFDIPLMSNIPNLVYLAPTNRQEYLAMLEWSINQGDYPVAIRAPRNGVYETKDYVDSDYSVLNKYKLIESGKKIAVFALGDFFQLGESLIEEIKKELGISPTLINPRYITGLDEELLHGLKENHEIIITLEDGVIDGGWGQKLASFYGTSHIRVMNYGLKKDFIDRYNVTTIMRQNRLLPHMIVSDIKKLNER